ncbi:tyrosine-type recombinase/integrase [Salinarimonas sp.]|uniref:tyrosine-type recombinase/integrase n=1 Tax=Salinarimonas sp. TaxID=2766526 RepID=UPI0032D9764E
MARSHVVAWNGRPVGEVNEGFAAAVRAAGLPPEVTPHALRHTAATWLRRAGVPLWDAAGYLGMSVEVLERVYGQHSPDHQAAAVEGIAKRKAR